MKAQTQGVGVYSSTVPLTLALDGGGWSVPHPGRFTPPESPGTHFIGGWVGPRAGLDGFREPRTHWDLITGPSNP